MAYEYRTSFTAAAQADREETIVDGRFSSSGDIALSDGSVTQGAIYFADDKNTGIYSPSNDTISFSTAGAHALTITPERTLKLGTGTVTNTGNYYNDIIIDNSDGTGDPGSGGAGKSCGVTLISKNDNWGAFMFSDEDTAFRGGIKYNHGSTEYMEIHSGGLNALTLDVDQNASFAGNVNVGGATGSLPRFVAYRATEYADNPVLQVRSNNGSSNRVLFQVDGNGASTFAGEVLIKNDKSDAYNAGNAIAVSQTLLELRNENEGLTAFTQMHFRTGGGGDGFFGTAQGAAANDCKFYWANQVDGGGGKILAELDSSNGNLSIIDGDLKVAADHGINFSAYATSASGSGSPDPSSNLLDDYEEGTWTPTSAIGTIAAGTCSYTKIGRLVTATFALTFPTSSTGGAQYLSGLPFTSINIDATGGVAWGYQTFSTDDGPVVSVDKQATVVKFYTENGSTSLTDTQLSGKSFRGVITYTAA